jgi:uncharacterized protein
MHADQQKIETADAGTIDDLDAAECWRLLATQPVGRVAVVVGQYPVVVPVNYALDGEAVVFQSGGGSKLTRIHGTHVTFEVDHIDLQHRTGWSVLIKGVAQGFNTRGTRDLAARSEGLGGAPWAGGGRPYLVRVAAEEITGRRVHPEEFPSSADLWWA